MDFKQSGASGYTYGGTEGIVVAPGENMAWAYYSINACEVAPLLILLTSRVPARTTADGIILDSNLLFHCNTWNRE